MTQRPAALAALLLLAGCPPSSVTYGEFDDYREEVDGRLDGVEQGGTNDTTIDLPTMAAELATLRVEHDALVLTVQTQEDEIAALSDEVDQLREDVDALMEEDPITRTELDTTLADYALASDVNDLSSTVSTHTGEIATLTSDVGTLQADVASLQTSQTTQDTEIAQLQADYASLGGTYATLAYVDTAIGNLDGTYTTPEEVDTAITDALLDLDEEYAKDEDVTTEIAAAILAAETDFNATYATDAELLAAAEASDVADFAQDARLDALEDDALTVVHRIETDTTYNVPADGTLDAVLADLDGYLVDADATVTIQLADGTYTFSDALEIRHPDGASIHIVGDEADPGAVELSFNAGSNGIVVQEGHALGYLAGVTVTGTGGEGIYAGYHSYLGLGPVAVSGFGYGLHAWMGSTIAPTPEFEATNTAIAGWVDTSDNTYGITADYGSTILADSAVSNNNGYRGIAARYGSTVRAQGAVVTGSGNDGVQGSYGSYLDMSSGTVSNSAGDGIIASYGGVATVGNASATDNGGSGLNVSNGSTAYADAATLSDNYYGTIVSNGSFLRGGFMEVSSNDESGLLANVLSGMDVQSSLVHDNGATGLVVNWGSMVDAQNIESEDNGGYGYDVQYNSTLYLYNVSSTGNTNGPYPAASTVAGTTTSSANSSSYIFN